MRVVFTTIWLACFTAVCHGQTSIDQVATAWQRRQDKVRAAEFHITATNTFYKGGFSFGEADHAIRPRPAEDTRTNYRVRYVLDGTKVRVESDGLQWNGTAFLQVRRTALMDGKIKSSLDEGERPEPQGLLSQESDYFEAKGQAARPITRCFRGTSRPMRSFLIDDLKPTGTRLPIGGRLCEQFILKRVGGDRSEFWLDPGRDWVLVRETYTDPKVIYSQLDISYEPNSACGWVPMGWEFRHMVHDAVPVCVQKFVVSKYSLNEAIPESEFTLRFPAGTRVRDQREGQPKKYVVTTETVQALSAPVVMRPWWHYAITALLGCGFVGIVALIARRRKREQMNPPSSAAP